MAAEERDLNRDPITDEPGAHPVATGVGATGGAMAGVAAGVIGGPVGMAVGGVVGAVVGGFAGKATGEAFNPTAEEAHWRENYNREPYYEAGRSYDDYAPAYRLGMHGRTRYENDWDAAEPRLASEWESTRGGSSLSWPEAQPASRAAWNRVDTSLASGEPSDSPRMSTTDSSLRSAGMDPVRQDMRSDDLGGTRSDSQSSGMSSGGIGHTDPVSRDMTTGFSGRDGSGGEAARYAGGIGSSSGMGTSGGMAMRGDSMATPAATGSGTGMAGQVGAMQSAGNDDGDRSDVIDTLNDLVECCKDGEHGFRECAEQAQRQDLKSTFLQRAEDCRSGAQELQQHIRSLGGEAEQSGSIAAALHRGWVSVKATLSTYDDKAVLEECERGEDNALARYRKALKTALPSEVKQLVERQMQGVQRNHDQIKMLRDQVRAAS